jgi:glutathione S-transferase
MLEELAVKYSREDYAPQFDNTSTDAYRKLDPTMKAPTVIAGDTTAWESNSFLRDLAATHVVGGRDTRNTSWTNPGEDVPIGKDD